MTSAQLAPAIVLPLIAWRVYVRVRRNIGRQPLVRRSLRIRIVVWSVLLALFAAIGALHPIALLGLGAGVVLSIALAWVGIRFTRFESTSAGDYYTPNTIIGVLISLLLVARIAYRMSVIFSRTADVGAPPATTFANPLTLGIFGLMAGYYIAYYAGVVIHARHLHPAAK